MDSKDSTTTDAPEPLPFGAIDDAPAPSRQRRRRKSKGRKSQTAGTPDDAGAADKAPDRASGGSGKGAGEAAETTGDRPADEKAKRADDSAGDGAAAEAGTVTSGATSGAPGGAPAPPAQGERRRRKRRRKRKGDAHERNGAPNAGTKTRKGAEKAPPQVVTGMFVLEKGGFGVLRRTEAQLRPSKEDVYVPKNLIHKNKLRDGALVTGRIVRGQKHRWQLLDLSEVDGKPPGAWANTAAFKNLTSIDPDFHYAVGDVTDEVSMRVVDLLCPVGRGQRGLIVASPRSGKTTLLRQFAAGIEKGYPDVHLFVLLVDERPEEATEWQRSVEHGTVFVSTADETSKNHIQLAEAVWKRACRLVEMGEDVVLLLDSITRLARAYNNQAGSGRTMSGGLDSRAMERPRKIFGSARNTVEAGSLTILGTTLVETGSRMDQLVFEEFKGTGNMELVLNRKLADRRIFPAIDVERTGTRKEEKLVGSRRLKLIHTLRRVLSRMSFIEAMELLITRLEDVEKTDDFLSRFEVDPEES